MKAKELRKKSIEELKKLIEEFRKNINQMMLDKSLKKLTKSHLLKNIKKDLARALTVINEMRTNTNNSRNQGKT